MPHRGHAAAAGKSSPPDAGYASPMLTVLALFSCVTVEARGTLRGPGTDPTEPTGPTRPPRDTAADTADSHGTTEVETVTVAHARELRGLWIATVWNIDFPSRTGLTADASKAELDVIVDVAARSGLNALFFQVRPEGDALYASSIEPWSRWLTGSQGADPGYDPLAYLLEIAHARGLEVHAWLNPYRAAVSSGDPVVSPHMAAVWPQHAHTYAGYLWMDPGAAEVRQRCVEVAADLAANHGVDGVHLDDYFYPYPDGTDFLDTTTWNAYVAGGGGLSRDDWRRDNVNQLVAELAAAVRAADPEVRFGIAPFGIYRPGQPAGITGLDQYAELYSDPLHWLDAGDVDYLAPQLYWPTTQTAQAYEPLLAWWSDQLTGDRHIFAGNALYQLGSSSAWTIGEIEAQVAVSRAYASAGSLGNIHYNTSALLDDLSGVQATFAATYAAPALPPPVPGVAGVVVPIPRVAADGGSWTITHDDPTIRGFTVYAEDSDGWRLDRIVPGVSASVVLGSGRWAVAAVSRGDVDSLGVVVDGG